MTRRAFTAASAWSSRDDWRDPEAQRRWWLLSLERRETGETQEAMRARRLGISVDELRARRAGRLAALAADAEADGYTRMGSEPGDPDATDLMLRVTLPPDDRPPWLVCAMCCRTMSKTKGRRVEVRPAVFCCRCCAGLPQEVPPEVLDQWLLDRAEYKRHAIAATYRVDPATMIAAETRAEVTRYLSDAEGMPLAVTVTPLSRPRTWCRCAPTSP